MSKDKAIAVAEYEDGPALRRAAINSFTKKELELFHELSDLSRTASSNLLYYWRDVGLKMLTAEKVSASGRNEYGAELVKRLSAALGVARASVDAAIRIAQLWPRKADYVKLVNRETENGYRLSWTHLQYLSSVSSDKAREKLINQSFNDEWTSLDLLAAIRKSVNAVGKKPSGRQVQAPKSVAACLSNAREMSRKLSQKVSQAWLSSSFDLVQAFERSPADYTTPELLSDIDATLKAVAQAKADLEKFENAVASVQQRAKRRSELATAASSGDVIEGTAVEVPVGECPHGGSHIWKTDDMGTFCDRCKEPFDTTEEAEPEKPKRRKKK